MCAQKVGLTGSQPAQPLHEATARDQRNYIKDQMGTPHLLERTPPPMDKLKIEKLVLSSEAGARIDRKMSKISYLAIFKT